jgi:hypothetical protein
MARIDLGLSDDEWLDMTPRQFAALRIRQMQKMQREELLVGILASSTVNSGFCRPDKPVSPESFMLHPFPVEPMRPLTGEDIMAAFAHIPDSRRATPRLALGKGNL